MTRSGSSLGLLDSIGEVGEGASRWDHALQPSWPLSYLELLRSRLGSSVTFGTGGGDRGSWIVDPDANNQSGKRLARKKIKGHIMNCVKKIRFFGDKGPFCSLVLWIIPGFYSLAQTQTLDNVMEKHKTFYIFSSPGFELLHKKPIWIFMGENTAS